MLRKSAISLLGSTLLFSIPTFVQIVSAADVETVGDLKVSGVIDNSNGDGIKFPDGNIQTSACSGCAGGILPISLGGTGITTAPPEAGWFLRSSGAGGWGVNIIQASDIPSLSGKYVDLNSAQMISGDKTFSGKVGIGAAASLFPMEIASATNGTVHARLGTNLPMYLMSNNPTVGFNAYWDGSGNFRYGTNGAAAYLGAYLGTLSIAMAPSGTAGAVASMTKVLTLDSSGKVGIGNTAPAYPLSVAGVIQSSSGGIMFPDGTVQTTAAVPPWSQILPAAERFLLVMSDAAVLDKETGLVWQRDTNSTMLTWANATSYCYNLSLGGRKGWRLPSVEELSSLVDPAQINHPPLPSGHPFTNPYPYLYYSSTMVASNPTDAWVVDFYDGSVYSGSKDYNLYVRCVRGGQ